MAEQVPRPLPDSHPDSSPAPTPPSPVTVFWRPGCHYCWRLRRGLHRAGVPFNEVNIWGDPNAAATVRSLAGGNETVPTVVIGERAFINPPLREVLREFERRAPGLLAERLPTVRNGLARRRRREAS